MDLEGVARRSGLQLGVPDLKVIRPSGDAGKARDYSHLRTTGNRYAREPQPRAAASPWAQAQPLDQAHWKL